VRKYTKSSGNCQLLKCLKAQTICFSGLFLNDSQPYGIELLDQENAQKKTTNMSKQGKRYVGFSSFKGMNMGL